VRMARLTFLTQPVRFISTGNHVASLSRSSSPRRRKHANITACLGANESRSKLVGLIGWGLRYSTEPLLGKLLAGNEGNYSYQLFRAGGVVENVVDFSGKGQLRVEAEYIARNEERGFCWAENG